MRQRHFKMAAAAATLVLVSSLLTSVVLAGSGDDVQGAADTEFHEREGTGGVISFHRVQTAAAARTTSSTAYTNLSAGSVPVGAGRSALITARWSGETSCTGGGASSNWCSLRIRIGGVDAHPQSGLDFAIDSTDGGTARFDDWEGHVVERSRCVRNTGTSTVNISVLVDWAVRNLDGGSAPVFRADDWHFTIDRSDTCSGTLN